jgi:hypothetical protein
MLIDVSLVQSEEKETGLKAFEDCRYVPITVSQSSVLALFAWQFLWFTACYATLKLFFVLYTSDSLVGSFKIHKKGEKKTRNCTYRYTKLNNL